MGAMNNIHVFGELCTRCKGRLWCGLPKCPILESVKDYLPRIRLSSGSIYGPSPPSIFVGRFGYPNVLAGPLVTEKREALFSSTKELYGKTFGDILSRTASLIRTAKRVNVKKMKGRIVKSSQEIAMSERALDTEIWIEKLYGYGDVDDYFHPTGPRIEPRKIDVVDNPLIPRKVDMLVEERLKATTAIYELYSYGYDVDYLQRLLSSGILGRERKLVPTRWSITAVDDIISRKLLQNVREYDEIGEIEYYFNSFMGNDFHIILIPGNWEYEMIESWLKGSLYSPSTSTLGEDYEPFEGRKDYASNITGAYYAARLAVVEYLSRRRKQAKVLIYREIKPEYKIPLGVWVIRETVRNAFLKKPVKFGEIDRAIMFAENKSRVKRWSKKSKILRNMKFQKKLEDFMR